METPTIVKQTKGYMLVKIPLPKAKRADISFPATKNGVMTATEKRGWKRLQEAEQDIKEGRIITTSSLKEALRRYDKKQWG